MEDQAGLVGNRVDCLGDLSVALDIGNGVKMADTLRFFTGDHPAAQFEQGTKQGGTYKCDVCGCKETMFNDQAHSLQYTWRDLQTLQTVAISGVHGKEAGAIKPFDNLKVAQLRTELTARGIQDTSMKKKALRDMLDNILHGVVRVPALLLPNPTQTLASLNLQKYEVLASEPLYDLKGHLINIIMFLSFSQKRTVHRSVITSYLLAWQKKKKSGADLRRLIQIFLLLKELDCGSKVLMLLQTIIIIGRILYSKERTPQ